MNFIKKSLKVFIGVVALIMFLVVAYMALNNSALENGSLKKWRAAALNQRVAAVKILTASDENTDLIVACVDKIAALPDSGTMAIRDAVSLCHSGVQLKQDS